MSTFRVVVSALEYLEADWDGSELVIYNPHLVITLVAKEHVLESLLRSLTTFLQAKLCDFVEKQRKQQQQQFRADPEICIPYMKAL